MKDNKKIVQVLTIITILFTIVGGTLAYWTWTTDSSQSTRVTFTTRADFSCSADGGGNISNTDISLAPTDCTDISRTIKRDVTSYIEIKKSGIDIKLNLWLKVNSLAVELSASDNFRYVLTTSSNSCHEGTILSSGSFRGLDKNDTVDILNNKVYSSTTTDRYYLYIWLDKEETNSNTMNKSFNFSLDGECTDIPQPEAPKLDEGMIPVTIDNNGNVYTVSKTDTSWYDYNNQEWANVVLVTDENRGTYLNNLSNNVQVAEEDILAYYVWIPRYKYRIPSPGKCSSIDNHSLTTTPECYAPYTISDSDKPNLIYFIYMLIVSEVEEYTIDDAANDLENALISGRFINEKFGIYVSFSEAIAIYNEYTGENIQFQGNYNPNNQLGNYSPTTIDIIFESPTSPKSFGDAVNTYYTHPAFTWDGESVSGIWVGKFETTPDKSSECYRNPNYETCNNNTQNPTVLPGESALRYQNISDMFLTSRNLTKTNNIYGLSNSKIDGHMIKNSEWGAAAYLSHSIYGINGYVAANKYYTLDQANGYITGCGTSTDNSICENAYGTDGVTNYPQSTTGNITGIFDMSGGSLEFVMGHYGNTVVDSYYSGFEVLPEKKYYDAYESTSCTLDMCGGHALDETLGWYQGDLRIVDSSSPWYLRFDLFDAISVTGGPDLSRSWRSALVVLE